MNKKKGVPLYKKVLICLMTTIMVIMCATVPSLAVTQVNFLRPRMMYNLPTTTQVSYFRLAVDDYIEELIEQSYIVTSKALDKEAILKDIQDKNVYSNKIRTPSLKASSTFDKELIPKIIDVNISTTKITIDTEVFYFKNSTDALAFVDKLNEQIKTEYSIIENIEINKDDLTDHSVLDKKIEDAKTERQEIEQRQRELEQKKKEEEAKQRELEQKKKKEEEAKKKQYKVTSRGSDSPRTSSQSTRFPLANYVYVSSRYGKRSGKLHTGIDLAASSGTHVYAWKSGTVTLSSWAGGYGNCILVKHSDGTTSRYAHLSGYNCSVGDKVAAGELIGYVGSTGNSTGPHLHFEVIINGSTVNPAPYLGL